MESSNPHDDETEVHTLEWAYTVFPHSEHGTQQGEDKNGGGRVARAEDGARETVVVQDPARLPDSVE